MGILKKETTPDYNKEKVANYFKKVFEALLKDLTTFKANLAKIKEKKGDIGNRDFENSIPNPLTFEKELTPKLNPEELTALKTKGGKSSLLYNRLMSQMNEAELAAVRKITDAVRIAHQVNDKQFDGKLSKSAVQIWREGTGGQTLQSIIDTYDSILKITDRGKGLKLGSALVVWIPSLGKKPRTWGK